MKDVFDTLNNLENSLDFNDFLDLETSGEVTHGDYDLDSEDFLKKVDAMDELELLEELDF